MDIVTVPPKDMPRLYPHLQWHFRSFADRSNGAIEPEDLYGEVLSNHRQCWIAWDGEIRACALTQVQEGRTRVVEVSHCAGRGREDWQQPIMEKIRDWARDIGASRLITINRPGYTKFLKSFGMRETHRIMEQSLG